MSVYHFTDSARLPYILGDGELRPGLNQLGNYPSDFIWVTTNDKGSRTAAGGGGPAKEHYRGGVTRLVRFTFPASAFIPWPDILKDHPEWTEADRQRLEQSARDLGDNEIASWRCRSESLPLAEAIRIETRAYTGNWEALNLPTSAYTFPNGAIGLKLGRLIYASRQIFAQSGVRGYELLEPVSPDALKTFGEAA